MFELLVLAGVFFAFVIVCVVVGGSRGQTPS